MPKRNIILATDETYHIFNKSAHNIPLFSNKKEYELFLETINYYLQINPSVKFSIYRYQKEKFPIDHSKVLVKIIAYCVMPTHYHFILTQLVSRGIHNFIHRLATSYAHYLNIKNEQKGPVFQDQFKAVIIESQEQLVHLSRYIHLNPVTSYLVDDPSKYPYSSYNIYLEKNKSNFVDPDVVMGNFKKPENYQKFVLDYKDYQRKLAYIKHLL